LSFPDLTERFLAHFHLVKKNPTFSFLKKLTQSFCRIPYENATKIIKARAFQEAERFRLPNEVFQNFLDHGTGGTCFSLTYFFYFILKECGFQLYPLMADRSYGKNTHCALIVILDGERYLIDPGFLLEVPIPLKCATGQIFPTSFNKICFVSHPVREEYDFYTWDHGIKKWRCRYKDHPVSWDLFMQYWSDSFNFSGMNSVVMTFVEGGKQYYLRNRHLRIMDKNGIRKMTVDPSQLSQFFANQNRPIRFIQQALSLV